jgi:hypothetical protein
MGTKSILLLDVSNYMRFAVSDCKKYTNSSIVKVQLFFAPQATIPEKAIMQSDTFNPYILTAQTPWAHTFRKL